MIPEAIIQRAYAALMKQEGIKFFDVMPSFDKLPAVILRSVQTEYKGRIGAECKTEFSIIAPGTSKKELYALAKNVIFVLPKMVDFGEEYQIENHKILTTLAANYQSSDRANATPEIWQMYNIVTRVTLTNCNYVD